MGWKCARRRRVRVIVSVLESASGASVMRRTANGKRRRVSRGWARRKSRVRRTNMKQKRKSHRRDGAHRQEEAMFAESAMNAQTSVDTVSLSTLLLASIGVFAVWQAYRCWALRGDGYEKLRDREGMGIGIGSEYQSV